MRTIRIVTGAGSGPTAVAAYDAALAAANVHNYNLIRVSSVIPGSVDVETVDTAPDLGAIGDRLTVVEARGTATGPDRAAAALAWGRREDGTGLFYEGEADDVASGNPVAAATERARTGLAAGRRLRDWTFEETGRTAVEVAPEDGAHGAAVVIAVYGRGTPIHEAF